MVYRKVKHDISLIHSNTGTWKELLPKLMGSTSVIRGAPRTMKDVRKASDEYLGSLDRHEVAVQPDESTRDQFDDPDIVDLLGADFNPDDMIED